MPFEELQSLHCAVDSLTNLKEIPLFVSAYFLCLTACGVIALF